MKPEAGIQRVILDWLAWERIWHMRMNTGASIIPGEAGRARRFVQYAKPGTADILASSREPRPRPVWIEVKAPQGRQSDAQKEFQAEVTAAGHVYLLARSLEDVVSFDGWRE